MITDINKYIVLSGRVHPGESNSSFCIQGSIQFLTSNAPEAKMLRSYFIFKIVPMLNPDGVALGSYRWSLMGIDLNRRWISPSPICHPTIFATKYLLKICEEEQGVALYTDYHGHSRKRNVFLYGWIGTPGDSNAAKISAIIKNFPFLVNQLNKQVSYKDWKFALEKEKESTARIVVFKELNIINSYTMEASFYKSDYKAMVKIKADMERDEQKSGNYVAARDKNLSCDESNI